MTSLCIINDFSFLIKIKAWYGLPHRGDSVLTYPRTQIYMYFKESSLPRCDSLSYFVASHWILSLKLKTGDAGQRGRNVIFGFLKYLFCHLYTKKDIVVASFMSN